MQTQYRWHFPDSRSSNIFSLLLFFQPPTHNNLRRAQQRARQRQRTPNSHRELPENSHSHLLETIIFRLIFHYFFKTYPGDRLKRKTVPSFTEHFEFGAILDFLDFKTNALWITFWNKSPPKTTARFPSNRSLPRPCFPLSHN